MMGEILDGKKLSEEIKSNIKNELTEIYAKTDKRCKLAVVMIGDDPASAIYVRNKIKGCEQCLIESVSVKLDANITEKEVEKAILNLVNSDVNGILIQLPIPKHLDEKKLLSLIPLEKDVDGFSEQNVGRLVLGEDCLLSCTPNGVIELLKKYKISMKGKNAVVIGRSNIVGKPMSLLLLRENCTVTVCHSKTEDISFYTKNADIIVVAIGKAKFLKGNMIKQGAVIVDVGMDRDENGKLCGDVDFDECSKKTSYITPVPGGVGPMTIAMLLKNTLKAFKKKYEL